MFKCVVFLLSGISLCSINVPAQSRTEHTNSWGIWAYPQQLKEQPYKNVMVARQWDNKVKSYLEKGGKVLLLADTAKIGGDADPVFSGISWNTVWSGMPPNLLGILCDPQRPVARQLLYSLKEYVNSNEFAPTVEVDAAMIDEIFK